MLKRLQVTNYALIDKLDITFDKGLNIITGETGAGKSILLGALNLILGNRADIQVLMDKEKKCIVEAIFEADKDIFTPLFDELEIDYESQCIIRREINKDGKSRSFVNDSPVNLSVLKTITSAFIDIHSQRENFALANIAYKYKVVDVFAGNKPLLETYANQLQDYKRIQLQLSQLQQEKLAASANFDFLQFQFNELEAAPLADDEPGASERELQTLNNAESIKLALQSAWAIIDNEEGSIVGLKNAVLQMQSIVKYDERYKLVMERMQSQLIEMKDIAAELEDCNEQINYDADRIQVLNDKLNVINRLLMKHRVSDCAALLQLKSQFSTQLYDANAYDEKIAAVQNELTLAKEKLNKISLSLFEARSKVIPVIEKKSQKILHELAMPDAILKIELNYNNDGDFGAAGCDEMIWKFQANKGHDLKELDKIASGGEMSRVMLALKAMLADVMQLPTMVFDEIDTGVSGNVAIKVGTIMQTVAKSHQVITITHLPQIAAKGTTHYYVYKDAINNKTFTSIKKLDPNERLMEVAKMIGGNTPSDAALTSARELMNG